MEEGRFSVMRGGFLFYIHVENGFFLLEAESLSIWAVQDMTKRYHIHQT